MSGIKARLAFPTGSSTNNEMIRHQGSMTGWGSCTQPLYQGSDKARAIPKTSTSESAMVIECDLESSHP